MKLLNLWQTLPLFLTSVTIHIVCDKFKLYLLPKSLFSSYFYLTEKLKVGRITKLPSVRVSMLKQLVCCQTDVYGFVFVSALIHSRVAASDNSNEQRIFRFHLARNIYWTNVHCQNIAIGSLTMGAVREAVASRVRNVEITAGYQSKELTA